MTAVEATWSTLDGLPCLRIRGVARDRTVVIRPRLESSPGTATGMAGTVVDSGDDRCFVPRYPFVEGAQYEVVVDGAVDAMLEHPSGGRMPVAEVVSIHPTSAVVPVNLLRLYVDFSQPMSEGTAHRSVRVVDEDRVELPGALLATDYELWDGAHRRLTVLLDPGRIKRGLADHEAAGYPLLPGRGFTLVVDGAFVDATGAPLKETAEREYSVSDAEYRPVTPADWVIRAPLTGSREPVVVDFDRPLDHALLARCLEVRDPAGRRLRGSSQTGVGEESWRFEPAAAWASGGHAIGIDPVLEDTAGNSVARVFDRDLGSNVGGYEPPVTSLPFRPRSRS